MLLVIRVSGLVHVPKAYFPFSGWRYPVSFVAKERLQRPLWRPGKRTPSGLTEWSTSAEWPILFPDTSLIRFQRWESIFDAILLEKLRKVELHFRSFSVVVYTLPLVGR